MGDGFAHLDVEGMPSHEDFSARSHARAERDFAAAGVVRYVALRAGVIAGGVSFHTADASRS